MQLLKSNQARVAAAPTRSNATSASMPVRGHVLQRKCVCGGSPGLAGECVKCANKRRTLQRRAVNEQEVSAVPPIVREVLRSPGQPLDLATRAFFEPRFGHDFSHVRVYASPTSLLAANPSDSVHEQGAGQVADRVMQMPEPGAPKGFTPCSGYDFSHVRVHTDARANESVRAVDALAYTVGRDVVFGKGQYAPGSYTGRSLLAHELAHVVQQSSGKVIQRWYNRPRLKRQLREKEAQLAELRSRIEESQARFVESRTSMATRGIEQKMVARSRADLAGLTGGPVSPSALRMLWRAVRVEQTSTFVRFVANTQLTFLGLDEAAGHERAKVEIPRIQQAIREGWTVRFTQGEYSGVTFTIDPRITYRPPAEPRDENAWQIEVQADNSKPASVTTWWNGIISLLPMHLEGDRVRTVAHELAHLFSLFDTYSLVKRDEAGKPLPNQIVWAGRSDPAGRTDLLGETDPIVLRKWLSEGLITQAEYDQQTRGVATLWQEEAEMILRQMGVPTAPQFELNQMARDVRSAKVEIDSLQWLDMVYESSRLEQEIEDLRRRLDRNAISRED